MADVWHLPFGAVSDPHGDGIAKPLGAWDESASIFRPFVLALSPSGERVFWELSQDFTDRPDDEPALTALEQLELPAREQSSVTWPADAAPQPSDRAFHPRSFIPYFRAIRFNTIALAGRMHDDRDRKVVEQETVMAESFLSAFDSWRQRFAAD